MKIVRVRYTAPYSTMIADMQRIFPEWELTAQKIIDLAGVLHDVQKKRFIYLKEFIENGSRVKVIAYSLVRDSFITPNWIQGTVLREVDLETEPIDHYFLGHEELRPDPPDEEPEVEIARVEPGGKA